MIIHPSNPTFDFLHCAEDAKHSKCKFALSANYGVLWISDDGRRLRQSPHCEKGSALTIVDLDALQSQIDSMFALEEYHALVLRKGIRRFVNVSFDEGFGVSGRLLVLCETKKAEFILHQFFNEKELAPLKAVLRAEEYVPMPGMARAFSKELLAVDVYEFLYGADFVETLLSNADFNTALRM